MDGTLQLPEIGDQQEFNLRRWREISADPLYRNFPGRVESNQFGIVLMSPPPGFSHGDRQFSVGTRLETLMKRGRITGEIPVSTPGGVRAPDAAWISDERLARSLRDDVLTIAPEICVEVLSPGNTRREMAEKRGLYFEAGAEEVWFCAADGRMGFFLKHDRDTAADRSALCPDFPASL